MFSERSIESGSGTFVLPQGVSHHLRDVLRAGPGDEFEVAAPDGSVYRAVLRGDGEAELLAEVAGASDVGTVVLYQAVPKGRRMEVVIEKAVELGVSRIAPIVTDRSVVRPGEGNKLQRWRRIAESAARQSLGERVPDVDAPVAFEDAVAGSSSPVLLHIGDELPFLEDVIEDEVGLFIGPEGGWSEAELELAGRSDIPVAQMGSRRLRSETAGIVAVVRARAAMETRARAMEQGGSI